ncbi:Pumilio-like 3 [Porphyridium purpureum]|uniref:Pumilio-like 3 n=1 Tax=Porphyridium purpureum TaxID=35688 RepID=A0A5J4YPR2_PORPP|nr:Pumilio-like 3 [Porphyridium purpureum]|eukprot:POR7740..scf236_6
MTSTGSGRKGGKPRASVPGKEGASGGKPSASGGKQSAPRKPAAQNRVVQKGKRTHVEDGKQDGERAEKQLKRPRKEKVSEKEDVLRKAKKIWEALRASVSSGPTSNGVPEGSKKEKKQQVQAQNLKWAKELHALFLGRIPEFLRNHEGSRIIQWILKCSELDTRRAVWAEVEPVLVDAAESKHGHFVVMELLGDKDRALRESVVEALLAPTPRLVRNVYGGDLIDYAYQTAASKAQKDIMVLEILLGKKRDLLTSVQARIKQAQRNPGSEQALPELKKGLVPGSLLSNVLAGDDMFAAPLLEAASDAVSAFADKAQTLRFGVIHRALWEYLSTYTDAQKMAEFTEPFIEFTPHMIHTREGALFTARMALVADAKSRKKLIRALRSLVYKVACDEFGHMLIVALLDCVDDTKLLAKAVLGELMEASADPNAVVPPTVLPASCAAVLSHKYARLALIHIFAPRTTRHFHPQLWCTVWDDSLRLHSKKEAGTRQRELFTVLHETLQKHLFQADAAHDGAVDQSYRLFVEIMGSSHGSQSLQEYLTCELLSAHEKELAAAHIVKIVAESVSRGQDEGAMNAEEGPSLFTGESANQQFTPVVSRFLVSLSKRCPPMRAALVAKMDEEPGFRERLEALSGHLVNVLSSE